MGQSHTIPGTSPLAAFIVQHTLQIPEILPSCTPRLISYPYRNKGVSCLTCIREFTGCPIWVVRIVVLLLVLLNTVVSLK